MTINTEVKKTRKKRITKIEKAAQDTAALAAKELAESNDATELATDATELAAKELAESNAATESAELAAKELADLLKEKEDLVKDDTKKIVNLKKSPVCIMGKTMSPGGEMVITDLMTSNTHGMKTLQRAIKLGFVKYV